MVFIIKKKGTYFELVRNVRKKGKHTREFLHYMGSDLKIPMHIIMKYEISDNNIQKMKSKYPGLIII